MDDIGLKKVFSVSELTSRITELLEVAFPLVWVEGEVSGIRKPSSGHIYFNLKDEDAQVRSVMFKHQARQIRKWREKEHQGSRDDSPQQSLFSQDRATTGRPPSVPFDIEDGQHVLVMGRVAVYAPRGEYQIIVESVEPVGVGAMTVAFEQLKARLKKKGYFDEDRKRPIPFIPENIAIVTSPTGAALFDMLKVIYQRHPEASVLVVPVRVQGEGADMEISEGIDLVNSHQLADVIIVGRGGGSLEDLRAFNEEVVANAIYQSGIPVISAVGHEIDLTISDLTADVRAPTPTAAAQMVVPRIDDLNITIDSLTERMVGKMRERIRGRGEKVGYLTGQLSSYVDSLGSLRLKIDNYLNAMRFAVSNILQSKKARLSALEKGLESLSPLSVLARGYSITQRADDDRIIMDVSDIDPGEMARIRLFSGSLLAKIVKK